MTPLHFELCVWLDERDITSDNIGDIRRSCFVPWLSLWNGIVREETAIRENKQRKVNMPNLQPNPTGGAPPMPTGPGTPLQPGQPSPTGAELPGFQAYTAEVLRGILSNPAAKLDEASVDGYTKLAILYTRSYLKHMANR